MFRTLSILALAFTFFVGAAYSDELVLKDGTTIECEIYKETKEHLYYVDAEKNKCRIVSRKSVQRVKMVKRPVVDIAAFLKKNGDDLTPKQKNELAAYLESCKKEELAAAERRKKMKMRTDGVKVLGDPKSDTRELLIDPFEGEPKRKAKHSKSSDKKSKKKDSDK